MLRALWSRWESYKYRFVPWIAFNLRHKRRTLRFVPEESKDKIVSDEDVLRTLLKTFRALFINDLSRQMFLLNFFPEIKSKYPELQTAHSTISKAIDDNQQSQIFFSPEEVFLSQTGTVYEKYEPIFFQSIGNPFIFRCIDGVLIDGNDKGISKAIYRPLRCVVLVALKNIGPGEELFSNYYTIIS
ncbi:hypothetical protein JD844_008555 [Phrynosoma platyrhinos]|uniref:SET domain-containing protein n=1 Tax=Phrynosoma platyrhinos TaxID=52577 RepID=A0ABQ7TDY8_PHRPL|nr:hypothetical protein JD844_008555 [Phrynosoma platyrhinos]